MKPSIRTFLLINLLLSVLLISSLAIIGNIYLARKDIQSQLDHTLISSTMRIKAFMSNYTSDMNLQKQQASLYRLAKEQKEVGEDESITFQVWNNQGKLILRSASAPKTPLSNGKPGLTTRHQDTAEWRVYTSYASSNQLTFIVAENSDYRQKLEKQLTKDSTFIVLITYPFLGFLIWIIVGRGLNPLKRIAKEIQHRAPSNLQPVEIKAVPHEIESLVQALNNLFERLLHAFEREKRFTADAAHELRTPLAAINAHAQVALKTEDKNDLKQILLKMVSSVTRSTHIIQQLLTLSRMVPEASINDPTEMDLESEVTTIAAQIAPEAIKKDIEIELLTRGEFRPIINGNPTAIAILARNLIDNAVRYSPPGSEISIQISTTNDKVTLQVIDNGPGIPEELRERVFERFYRILGNKSPGSGLGLGIVLQITKLHDANIELHTSPGGNGLDVRIIFKRLPR